jgi:hypothetical protein
MMNSRRTIVGLGLVLGICAGPVVSGLVVADPIKTHVEIETGFVFSGRNDARIPGDTGTTISLTADLSTKPSPVFRIRAGLRFANRHVVSGLYAPLTLTARGSVNRDIQFEGATFAAGSPLLAVYRFDSYRLRYRYSILLREELEIAAGLTGKIRRAETSLYGEDARRKTNTGFVPLASVHIKWRPRGGKFGVVLDADALAAPQGRAEDVLLAVTWQIRDEVGLRVGYRMLEGGADNDEVYSFAWLHYAVAGVDLRF